MEKIKPYNSINLKNITKYFTESYSHAAMFLVLITLLVSIPFTLGIYKQQQDKQQSIEVQITQDITGDINGGGQGLPPGVACATAGCYYTATGQEYQLGGGGGGQQNYLNCTAATIDPATGQMVCSNPYGQQQQQIQVTTPQNNTQTQTTAATGVCTVADSDFAMDTNEQQILTLINQYRQQNNLPPLTVSATLTRGAQWMADDMATSGNINGHTDSLGRSYSGRAAACGYPASTTAVDIVMASGNTTPQIVFNGWVASGSHQPVLLNNVTGVTRNWQGIGIGRSTKGTGGLNQRWVVMFGEANDGGTVPTATPPTPTFTPTPTPTTTITTTPNTTPGACHCNFPGVKDFACGETTASYCPVVGGIAYECTAQGWVQSSVACAGGSQTTITPTITTFPVSEGMNFTVSIPGVGSKSNIGENPSPRLGMINLFVQLSDPITDQPQAINSLATMVYLPNQSMFSGGAPASPGTYHVRARTNNSLWKDVGIHTITANNAINIATIPLTTGDLNQDNILNLADYNIFVSCFGNKSCSNKSIADINYDGKVSDIDLNIFYSALANRQGD